MRGRIAKTVIHFMFTDQLSLTCSESYSLRRDVWRRFSLVPVDDTRQGVQRWPGREETAAANLCRIVHVAGLSLKQRHGVGCRGPGHARFPVCGAHNSF